MPISSRFPPVTHCIFDNDGTLMDTEKLYSQAVEMTVLPYNKKYTFELKLRCMGLPAMEVSKLIVNELKLPITPEQFLQENSANTRRVLDHTRLMPGAEQLVLHLHNHQIPMAIATSSARRSFAIKARPHLELLSCFSHIVYGCDPELEHGKPAPDIFLLAASRFNCSAQPECCLVFEDSPNGVQGARAAGMQCVMTPDPRMPKEYTKCATQVLPSLLDFVPEDFGLPPYDTCSLFQFG
ncbi:pseudouridine-5'-phosphatase-like [Scaptodrosophila lebanonensis]|uniref:pseudouridine 5'-phosphatase n=1 Tax=Drosophila lebanonensis TaxID=7225 RepID=A0A6J2U848_DROLE|nr:pseudouridine-5'-phosphatase-like [Scaptodrosophila lebanonensis]